MEGPHFVKRYKRKRLYYQPNQSNRRVYSIQQLKHQISNLDGPSSVSLQSLYHLSFKQRLKQVHLKGHGKSTHSTDQHTIV